VTALRAIQVAMQISTFLLEEYWQLVNHRIDSTPTEISTNGEATSLNIDTKPVDEAAIIEERRKRRAEIKAKHMGGVTNANSAAASPKPDSSIDVPQAIGITHNLPFCAHLLTTMCRFSSCITSSNAQRSIWTGESCSFRV